MDISTFRWPSKFYIGLSKYHFPIRRGSVLVRCDQQFLTIRTIVSEGIELESKSKRFFVFKMSHFRVVETYRINVEEEI